MLFNTLGQTIILNKRQRQVCDEGFAAISKIDEDITAEERAAINTRRNILRPLKEVLKQPDPNGRGCCGMFSILVRARLITNNKNRCFN